MKKINKFSMIAIIMLSFNQMAQAQWRKMSSGISASQRGLYEMTAPDNRNCYATTYDKSNFFNFLNQIAITNNGGDTWRSVTLDSLKSNFLMDIAASSAKVVHVIGWNSVSGGGNVFKSTDGGNSWYREAPNAFTNPSSYPDGILFFNTRDGVIFGDPTNGYFEIYTTSNAGSTWTRVPSVNIPSPLAPAEAGLNLMMDHYNNTIWAQTVVFNSDGSTRSRLLRSDDKGLHWYVKCPNLPLVFSDGRLRFRNERVGLYKNNEKLYRTTDGGATWNQVNYTGTWFSYDFDNIPGRPGVWISTGGDVNKPLQSAKGLGSSISYDDGNSWHTLDTAVDHTCINMTNSSFGFGGGITSGSGTDGAFVYSLVNNSCGKFVQVEDIASASPLSISAFPNPSKSTFNLQVNSIDNKDVDVNIIDFQGRIINSMVTAPNQFKVFGNELKAGVYMIEVRQGNKVKTMRVVKY